MKVFISCDFEGISGISSFDELRPGHYNFSCARKLLTSELNAVIKGIKDFTKDIIICDSHALGENVLINELPEYVKVVKGYPRPFYMLHGLDESFTVVFFIGYHAGVGDMFGMMDHSYSGSAIYEVKLNDEYMSEIEINAGLAGHYNVPVGLVSGDSATIKRVKSILRNVETVITKEGISRYAGLMRHPEDVHKELYEKSKKVMKHLDRLEPFKLDYPLHAEIKFVDTHACDLVAILPYVNRKDGRTIEFESPSMPHFYRMLITMTHLARSVKR